MFDIFQSFRKTENSDRAWDLINFWGARESHGFFFIKFIIPYLFYIYSYLKKEKNTMNRNWYSQAQDPAWDIKPVKTYSSVFRWHHCLFDISMMLNYQSIQASRLECIIKKYTFLISQPRHVDTQMNHLIEMVLLSTQNKWWLRKYLQFYTHFFIRTIRLFDFVASHSPVFFILEFQANLKLCFPDNIFFPFQIKACLELCCLVCRLWKNQILFVVLMSKNDKYH